MIRDILLAVAILFPLVLPTTHGEIEKRQVGVLARTGVLPQTGKRGLESLARNGELPGKRMDGYDTEERQRLSSLLRWLQEQNAAQLQREMEQNLIKRNVEAMARSGYLVKPATEPPESRSDLLDPEDFLGKTYSDTLENEASFLTNAERKRGGLASLARHGYIGKRFSDDDHSDDYDEDDDDDDEDIDDDDDESDEESVEDDIKRSIGAAKHFLHNKRNIAAFRNFISRSGKRNLGSFRKFSGKRNIGSARNFATMKRDYYGEDLSDWYGVDGKRNIASALRFSDGKRNLGAARNFQFREGKRNIGAARNFFSSGNKKNVGAARNFWYGKRNIASLAREGGLSNLKFGRETDYPWDDDEFDFDDFHDEDKRHLASFLRAQGKRHLGSLYAGKRNVAAFKNFGKRLSDAANANSLASALSDPADAHVDDFLGKELDGASAIEKRETKSNGAGQDPAGHQGLSRRKRSAEFVLPSAEYSMPGGSDYSDYEDDVLASTIEKRFLGSEPWTDQTTEVSKRHIGALARLGLLPSFRSTRYSRSGRAIDSRMKPYRETSTTWTCPCEATTPTWKKASSVEAQLALRQLRREPIAYVPTRTRHPMSYYRSNNY